MKRQIWRLIWMGCLCLCFFSSDASVQAHMTSMGEFFVKVRPETRTADLVISISQDDLGTFLKLDTDNNRRIDESELTPHRGVISGYLASKLIFSNNGEVCPVKQQRFLPEREKKSRRRVFFALQVECPTALSRVLIENTVMFEDVGGYSHIARIQVGTKVYAPYFSRIAPRYAIELQAAPVTTTQEPSTKPKSSSIRSKGEGWFASLWRYIFKGGWHIFIGTDHIAFIFCLLLVAKELSHLIWVITSFTIGHSITLVLCVLKIVPPMPEQPIESMIALTIAYVAVENILQRHQDTPPPSRVLLTCLFGTIHGFGFSYTLYNLQLPQESLVPALAGFNIGIEAGQIIIVALIYPWLRKLMQREDYWKYQVAASGVVTAIAMYWFVTRAFF